MEINRRDFLKITGFGTLTTLEAWLIYELMKPKQALDADGGLSPDVEIPQEQSLKITEIDEKLISIGEKIQKEEGVAIPKLNSDSILAIYQAKLNLRPGVRNGIFVNSDDFKVWITEKGSYKYDFESDEVKFSGGKPEIQAQARDLFSAYMAKDQWRVAEVKLTDRNSAGGNIIQWQAGDMYQNIPLQWDFYRTYVHEITHTGTPLNYFKFVGDKSLLLPYGLRRTLDFTNEWLEAMDNEYEYFQKYFFRARGDETLGRIREEGVGNFGTALNEIIAMSCTDYILPPTNEELINIVSNGDEPFAAYPLTEKAVKRSIAYVHYGVKAGEQYPNGVEGRNGLQNGNVVGDIFRKTYQLATQS